MSSLFVLGASWSHKALHEHRSYARKERKEIESLTKNGTHRFLQNQNSVPATAPPITIKDPITPTITKIFPLDSLLFMASRTLSLFVAVLFVCLVGGIRSDVNSVVEVSVAKSFGRLVVSGPVVNVVVETFLKGTAVVSFFSTNSVVISLLVVLGFVLGVVVTCEETVVVPRVTLLLAVEAMVEVLVIIIVVSFCFCVVTALLVVLVCGMVVTSEDIIVRRVLFLLAVEAMVEVVVTAVCEEGEDVQWIMYFSQESQLGYLKTAITEPRYKVALRGTKQQT